MTPFLAAIGIGVIVALFAFGAALFLRPKPDDNPTELDSGVR